MIVKLGPICVLSRLKTWRLHRIVFQNWGRKKLISKRNGGSMHLPSTHCNFDQYSNRSVGGEGRERNEERFKVAKGGTWFFYGENYWSEQGVSLILIWKEREKRWRMDMKSICLQIIQWWLMDWWRCFQKGTKSTNGCPKNERGITCRPSVLKGLGKEECCRVWCFIISFVGSVERCFYPDVDFNKFHWLFCVTRNFIHKYLWHGGEGVQRESRII